MIQKILEDEFIDEKIILNMKHSFACGMLRPVAKVYMFGRWHPLSVTK